LFAEGSLYAEGSAIERLNTSRGSLEKWRQSHSLCLGVLLIISWY
jgi:hypothetical protein